MYIGNVWVGAVWKMWFNNSYYQYVSREGIENFRECDSNVALSDTCRCIRLHEHFWEYAKAENRERQRKFKESINFDETVERMGKMAVCSDDSHIEIMNGKFEHGGEKLIKIYLDKDGNNIEKSKAQSVKIIEFDKKGLPIWRVKEKIN